MTILTQVTLAKSLFEKKRLSRFTIFRVEFLTKSTFFVSSGIELPGLNSFISIIIHHHPSSSIITHQCQMVNVTWPMPHDQYYKAHCHTANAVKPIAIWPMPHDQCHTAYTAWPILPSPLPHGESHIANATWRMPHGQHYTAHYRMVMEPIAGWPMPDGQCHMVNAKWRMLNGEC